MFWNHGSPKYYAVNFVMWVLPMLALSKNVLGITSKMNVITVLYVTADVFHWSLY